MSVQATVVTPEADPRITRPVTQLNAPDPKAAAESDDIAAALAVIEKTKDEPDPVGAAAREKANADAKSDTATDTATKPKDANDPDGPARGEDGKFLPKGGAAEGEKERKGEAKAEKDEPTKDAKPKDDAKPEPEKPRDRKAEHFAKKAEEERRARATEAKLKADRDQIAADRAALAAEREKFAEARKDPIAYLKAAGYELDDAIRHAISGAKKPDLTPEEKAAAIADARVKAILDERDKAAEEKTKAERTKLEQAEAAEGQQRITRQRVEARDLVDAAHEKYPTIYLLGAYDTVVRAHYVLFNEGDARHGVTPGTKVPLDKVAEMLEAEMRETFAERSARVPQYLASLAPKPAGEAQVRHQSPGDPVRNAAPNAISQRKAAPIATPSDERRDLSEEERLAEAMKHLVYSHDA